MGRSGAYLAEGVYTPCRYIERFRKAPPSNRENRQKPDREFWWNKARWSEETGKGPSWSRHHLGNASQDEVNTRNHPAFFSTPPEPLREASSLSTDYTAIFLSPPLLTIQPVLSPPLAIQPVLSPPLTI